MPARPLMLALYVAEESPTFRTFRVTVWMPARSPIAIDGLLKLLGSVENPAFLSAVQVAGLTPVVVPHRNARKSLKPASYTSPGCAALFGFTWPAPWRKMRLAVEMPPSR